LDNNTRFTSESTRNLLADAEGQVVQAVSKQEWYTRWGSNYIFSLSSAHRQQRCNNFKDIGVANYGGALFAQQRDRADDIFSSLPPPQPSRQNRSMDTAGAAKAPINFAATFNNCDNPCFHHLSLVRMADGSYKKMEDLRPGDSIARVSYPSLSSQEDGATSPKVRCIVKTDCAAWKERMVALNAGRLVITPWHPVLSGEEWKFPAELAAPEETACTHVYSLVLDSCHAVEVGGVVCVTLGHGLSEPVAQHDYFGTARVVKDLERMPGYAAGLLHFEHGCIQRGPDGRALGFDTLRLHKPQCG